MQSSLVLYNMLCVMSLLFFLTKTVNREFIKMCVSSQNFLFDYAYVTKPLYQNIVYFIYYQNLVIIHGNQILFIEDFYMCLDTK